jgi:putative alpha-1,2-mannosidase
LADLFALISAADEKYFPLVRGLVQSVHDAGWAKKLDICIIDLGMTQGQLRELAPLIACAAEGKWDADNRIALNIELLQPAQVANDVLPAEDSDDMAIGHDDELIDAITVHLLHRRPHF